VVQKKNDPETRRIAQLGGLTLAARQNETERRAQTAKARAALDAKFNSEPNPDAARRLYYAQLAYKSAKVRRARRAEREAQARETELDAIAALEAQLAEPPELPEPSRSRRKNP
jgi:hypothetical protein